MNILSILAAGIAGTTMMTLFSQVCAWVSGEECNEAKLLNLLIKRSTDADRMEKTSAPGWILHYIVGFIFAAAFFILWNTTTLPMNFKTSLLFGFIAGVVGVVVWKIVFELHHRPPKINFALYFTQLIFAHVIFALIVYFVYNQLDILDLN